VTAPVQKLDIVTSHKSSRYTSDEKVLDIRATKVLDIRATKVLDIRAAEVLDIVSRRLDIVLQRLDIVRYKD